MWNIIGSGQCTLLTAIWPGEGPVWEEVLGERTPVSVFCITPNPESCHITACTTAVTVCIFDILTDAEKEQVLRISATILSSPLQKKKKSRLRSIELSECIIVIYGNLTFKLSFATKHYLRSFPEEKEEAQREGKKNELMCFRWTDSKDRSEIRECLWTFDLFRPAISSE